RSRGPPAGHRARSTQAVAPQIRKRAPVSLAPRRARRSAQLPQPRLETRTARHRDHAAAARLRSTPHLRDLRPSCRHLHLRPFALHGHQPDDDRPPLRPSRPRRPRARDSSLLDAFTDSEAVGVHAVDAAWTPEASTVVLSDNGKAKLIRKNPEAL